MKDKIKISIVNYTNTLPFLWGINNSTLREDIDLQEDIPSKCAAKLLDGSVDIALLPTGVLSEVKNYTIVSNYCIGANGAVKSVKLYSHVPLNEIKTIYLDYQSRTSVLLVQLLCRYWWKIYPKFTQAAPGYENQLKDGCAGLVIGDRTFGMNSHFNYEYDLAEEWKKFTGMPFVFAVWASLKQIPADFLTSFNNALKLGVENIDKSVHEAEKLPITKIEAFDYLTNNIDFILDEEKKKAIDVFLSKV